MIEKTYMNVWKIFTDNKYNSNIMIVNKVCQKILDLINKKDIQPTQELIDNLKNIKNIF